MLEESAADHWATQTSDLERLASAAFAPAVATSRLKVAVDITLALVALVLLLPAFALIAVLVILDSGGPPMRSEVRIGLNGRPFRLWNFRTGVVPSEARRQRPTPPPTPLPAFTVRQDPPLSRLGRLLRLTGLDALPQLWSVVAGDMSLVGPRPALPEEVIHYDVVARRRLRARPGLTCFWQIENRSRSGAAYDKWLERDLEYLAEWTMTLDLVLIGRSLRDMVRIFRR